MKLLLSAMLATLMTLGASQLYAAPNNTSDSDISEQYEKISLNSAPATALETLPGIGPKKAEEIITYRDKHGRFTSVEELRDVKGIGAVTLEKIKPHVTVSP